MFRIPRLLLITALWLCVDACAPRAHAQFFGDAEALFLNRSNNASIPVLAGPQGTSAGDDFDYATGFRLTLGAELAEQWEVEAVFSQVEDWDKSSLSNIAAAISLDGDAANAVVFPGGPVNNFVGPSAIRTAATRFDPTPAFNETNESEFLLPGATLLVDQSAEFRNLELTFGNSRNVGWLRWGVGYRNILLSDRNGVFLTGNFDARDTDDAAQPGGGTNEPNDGLGNAALTAAGYQIVSGGGDGYNSIDPANGLQDRIVIYNQGSAENELNGGQLTVAGRLYPGDYFTVEGFAKAGLYHNVSHGRYIDQVGAVAPGNDDSVYRRQFNDKKHTAAFAGALGFKVYLPVTDYISVVTGYEGTYISGVALGADQAGQVRTTPLGATSFSVNSSGYTILHGGNVGLQLTW